jgi:tetratricopeptide (TPR) repeat protein
MQCKCSGATPLIYCNQRHIAVFNGAPERRPYRKKDPKAENRRASSIRPGGEVFREVQPAERVRATVWLFLKVDSWPISRASGRPPTAIAESDRSLAINPRSAAVLNNRAVSCCWNGEYEKSIQSPAAAVRIHPEEARMYNNLGLAYADLGKFDKPLRHSGKGETT